MHISFTNTQSCEPEEFHTKEKFPVEREKKIGLLSGLKKKKKDIPPSKKKCLAVEK